MKQGQVCNDEGPLEIPGKRDLTVGFNGGVIHRTEKDVRNTKVGGSKPSGSDTPTGSSVHYKYIEEEELSLGTLELHAVRPSSELLIQLQ